MKSFFSARINLYTRNQNFKLCKIFFQNTTFFEIQFNTLNFLINKLKLIIFLNKLFNLNFF